MEFTHTHPFNGKLNTKIKKPASDSLMTRSYCVLPSMFLVHWPHSDLDSWERIYFLKMSSVQGDCKYVLILMLC